MGIDGKSCFSVKKTKTNDLDQRTACGAPVRWSKYTTLLVRKLILNMYGLIKPCFKYTSLKIIPKKTHLTSFTMSDN